MSSRPVVVIVGAGFSGLLTALHLASDPGGPQVRLVERAGVFGRGTAYSTANPDHLLNVRVANMSAFPDLPDHFTQWLAGRSGWSAHGGFVTRGIYGDYLQDLLRDALERLGADRLLLEQDEAVDITPAGDGRWRVRLALGRELAADAVVLASGVLRPAPPAGADPGLFASPRYFADPWSRADRLAAETGDVLLLGTAMTMVDAALTLARPGRRIWAISRRGLLPRAHAPVAARPPSPAPGGSPLAVLRQVRENADRFGWHEAVDDLRPHVRSLWGRWSPAERAAFLRHARPWWDVHRHRLAPSVARQITAMARARDLTVRAGEIQSLVPVGDRIEVVWRPRGGLATRRLSVSAVVNCTGLLGDLALTDDALLRRLLSQGLIRGDALRLGLEVDAASQPVGRDGTTRVGFHAVGPLTRGGVWENTAVPDIRVQAADVAGQISRALTRAAAA
ncbi:FAD/NAD(P)-binding protein [Phenylobacterium aquaticum]|uniref:FAD/NAD(P)-binding protein n=2 Tax=Phenylobacterium aquaticum TaxID=1763816 RepID=UPI0026F056C4|nr:FAD/NAD(P)-binding protein [Phenylobacterium aquaticum]